MYIIMVKVLKLNTMKLFLLFSTSAFAASSARGDAAAMEYCRSGCAPEDQLSSGVCQGRRFLDDPMGRI